MVSLSNRRVKLLAEVRDGSSWFSQSRSRGITEEGQTTSVELQSVNSPNAKKQTQSWSPENQGEVEWRELTKANGEFNKTTDKNSILSLLVYISQYIVLTYWSSFKTPTVCLCLYIIIRY